MYTHCMFCHADLGTNEIVEHFPVGRRLAYDQERGRLWVVCPRCHRWNLTPIEERWEALEECEKAFRPSRLKASTENISVARTAEGLDLVRIGRPRRRELAFWRWGDRFGARRKRALLWTGIGATVGTVAVIGNLTTGGGVFLGLSGLMSLGNLIRDSRGRVRVEGDDGRPITVRGNAASLTRFGRPDGSGVPSLVVKPDWGERTITGERALRAAALILPRVNRKGANDEVVRRAADEIEAGGGPEGYVSKTWGDRTLAGLAMFRPMGAAGIPGVLSRLPVTTRVGLEMALHEEEERRALDGELAGLEEMWRSAEEIAAISDDLLLPAGWATFRKKHGREESEG